MLTRLKVTGFKNLVDLDISFGPFTCIAGANGTGKSNLFDAIKFLSDLSKNALTNAALLVRAEEGRSSDIKNIFFRSGEQSDYRMSFEAEMIIPGEGVDEREQKAKASITFVCYRLELTYQIDDASPTLGSIKILKEELERINLGDAAKHLRFPHSYKNWRKSVIHGRKTTPFISTHQDGEKIFINLHQDGGGGMYNSSPAKNLKRTVLSTVNASESPTAFLARQEMSSWRIQELEPSALRRPDKFMQEPVLGNNGSHLPAYLYDLARNYKSDDGEVRSDTWVYDQITGRLTDLISDVREVKIDRDEKQEILTLVVKDFEGTEHPAHALSDGTLRFLALAALEQDQKAGGLLCLEEPENGIHPQRISSMLDLLQCIAVDVELPSGLDNPMRQVIINTHSPLVVATVPDDSLLVAVLREKILDGRRVKVASFSWLPETWREAAFPDTFPLPRGIILEYLNYHLPKDPETENPTEGVPRKIPRVAARKDLAPYFPFMTDEDE